MNDRLRQTAERSLTVLTNAKAQIRQVLHDPHVPASAHAHLETAMVDLQSVALVLSMFARRRGRRSTRP